MMNVNKGCKYYSVATHTHPPISIFPHHLPMNFAFVWIVVHNFGCWFTRQNMWHGDNDTKKSIQIIVENGFWQKVNAQTLVRIFNIIVA